MAQIARNGAPPLVLLGLPVLLVVLYVLMRVAARRSATITGPEHVLVRVPFRTRRTTWRDIQAIEIHSNPAAVGDSNVMAEYAVLYDCHGRQTSLPHLNSRAQLALHDEVRDLRALWERLRGDDWVALPEVAAKVVKVRRTTDRARAWTVASLAAGGAMVGTVVLFLVLVLSGALDDLDGPMTVLLSPGMIFVVPVVVYAAVLVSYSRRRRRERNTEIR
ncbi:hypothetical protein ACFVW8_11610 [Streptomyces sp. NPDC058221]|uniref:hypothetical protein n=1 Tax=Streptomyces sp. NPDC058221 TaxID=3346388 RepID=UPI0036EABE7F